MIHGLFLDPRAWQIDFTSSAFWNPNKHGLQIDLHTGAFNIPKQGIKPKYKFVIATEVWEIPMRKTLKYLRAKGVKVFLAPREPFKTDILKDAMFSYDKFLWENEYYFTPDAVLAAGEAYADLWQGKAKTFITGYPRFDYYASSDKWESKAQVAKKYGLNPAKKWIFFPSYPPYHYKKIDGKDVMIDLKEARESTLQALEAYAKAHPEYQVVVKIHPQSMKPFLKKTGRGDEVSGLLLERYKKPTDSMKVIGDQRNSGLIAKELLINSDIICGFTSTMLMEAAILNKPVVHVLFSNTKDLKGIPEYAKYTPSAYDEAELHGLLDQASPTSNPMVEKYLFKVDGKACERICTAVKSML